MDIRVLIERARKGTADDKLSLARKYYTGFGKIEQDTEYALMWFKEAAEAGSIDALCFLGHGFVGDLVSREDRIKYLSEAIKYLSPLAPNYLGELYYNGGAASKSDLRRALYLFHHAARAGNSWGDYNLYEMYKYGHFVNKNEKTALKWLKSAILNDNPAAIEVAKNDKALHHLYLDALKKKKERNDEAD